MYLIRQWNHPEFIYLLIPLTFCVLTSIYGYFWSRFRALKVDEAFNPNPRKINYRAVHAHFIAIEAVIFILSCIVIITLPKALPLFAFLMGLVFSSVFCISLVFYLKWYIQKKNYVPEVVEQNIDSWKDRTYPRLRAARPVLFLLSMVLMILAVMDPEGTEKTSKLRRTPLNVTIVLDLSRSMDAQDFEPSRLTVAKDEISRLLAHGSGDEIGLVYFTDTAVIQAPQTLDTQSIQSFLKIVTTDSMPTHGTDINLALQTALRTFNTSADLSYKSSDHATRRVVLVTDGESHTGDIDATLNQFVERGIHIDVIAIGSENGSEIFDRHGNALKYQNTSVITRLQPAFLQNIAQKTDGMYVPYQVPDMAAEAILSNWDVVRVTSKPKGLASSLYRNQLYQFFLYPAFIILLLALIHPLIVRMFRPFYLYLERRKQAKQADAERERQHNLED